MPKAETKRFYCKSGSQLAEKHAIRIDDNGHKRLVKTGEFTNIYEKIQSHADEVDIEKLWERCQMEGYEILNKREAISGDVTMIPNSLLEASIMLQDRENEFNQLPLDIRKQFNFSFNEYIAEASNDLKSWASKMGLVEKAGSDQPKVEEPAPNEGGEN